jgi:two-component system response regulator YesN
MLYSVFLVEDEMMTREGIRESIDWAAAQCRFCGEASDGELALPLILERRPDIVITDIQMPFMDGLQLCRLVKSALPETKVIILSGHDEFKYAQTAIQLGVHEYLLKPVSPHEFLNSLQNITRQLSAARQETEQLNRMQRQVAAHRTMLREHCMANLLIGALSPTELIKYSRELDLDLLARWYQVLVVRSTATNGNSLDSVLADALGDDPQAIWFHKDHATIVCILKHAELEQLEQRGQRLEQLLQQQAQVQVGRSQPTERLGGIAALFQQVHDSLGPQTTAQTMQPNDARRCNGLAKPNTSAFTQFLRSGSASELNNAFAAYLAPLQHDAPPSAQQLSYIFTDLILTLASFVRDIGGENQALLDELAQLEGQGQQLRSFTQITEQLQPTVLRALHHRDLHVHGHSSLINKARSYIDAHYADPSLSLSKVAAHVMLSPSYFSMLFSRAMGETFIEYVTKRKIQRAKQLLQTTTLTSSEVAYQVGYDNPRYFYAVFRKVVGHSPNKFRQLA